MKTLVKPTETRVTMIETMDMSVVSLTAFEAVSVILGVTFWAALLSSWLG